MLEKGSKYIEMFKVSIIDSTEFTLKTLVLLSPTVCSVLIMMTVMMVIMVIIYVQSKSCLIPLETIHVLFFSAGYGTFLDLNVCAVFNTLTLLQLYVFIPG